MVNKANFAQTKHLLDRPIVYHLGIGGIGYIPTCLSYTFAERIADLSFIFYKKARENVKKNLRNVFPGIPEKEVSAIALKTFRNYSNYIVDFGSDLP